MIAGRYRLDQRLGRGAHSEVWRARDVHAGADVAVKLFAPTDRPERVRREIAALRLLRVPGVVRILDEGDEAGRAFLVMEVARGRPFPSGPSIASWESLARPTTSLLSTLQRVHSVGVLHRDLKPANVLVGDDGHVTILDFGISRLRGSRADDLTAEGTWHGTPAYISPEQLFGDPHGPAADLYAVGVMLFDALAGRLPHPNARGALLGRAIAKPPPLAAVAPRVPVDVCNLVDALLSPSPTDRPRSAAQALAHLEGQQVVEPLSRWLGSRDVVDRASDSLASGRPFVVQGFEGCEPDRFFAEVAEALLHKGRRVIRLGSNVDALAVLACEVAQGVERGVRLHELEARLARALREELSDRACLLVADTGAFDRSVERVLSALPERLPVLRVFSGAEHPRPDGRLEPWTASDLKPLIVGLDRLFHAREDAAALLYDRTRGIPARVASELAAWSELGLATSIGDGIEMHREAVASLRAGLVPRAPMAIGRARSSLALEVAAWLTVAGGPVSLDVLARWMDLPGWRVDRAAEELYAAGAIRAEADELEILSPLDLPCVWTVERIESARRAALADTEVGDPRRLRLLIADDAPLDEIAGEAVRLARRLFDDGEAGLACSTLEGVARLTRGAPPGVAVRIVDLFETWLAMACGENMPFEVDRVLYEIERATTRSAQLERLADLARAALIVTQDPPRALRDLLALGRFDSDAIEGSRINLAMIAARSGSVGAEQAVLDEFGSGSTPDMRGRILGWRGKVAYGRAEFAQSAQLHLEAAAAATARFQRIASLTNAASSLLEAFDFDRALTIAADAARALEHRRFPLLECRAEWLQRAARYRRGESLTPDLELVEAADALRIPLTFALVALTEGAIAWRSGEHDHCRGLCRKAQEAWDRTRTYRELAVLARCLAVAAGELVDEAEVAELIRLAAGAGGAGVGIQALGLLRAADIPSRDVERLCATVSRSHWGARIDVISVDEARLRLR